MREISADQIVANLAGVIRGWLVAYGNGGDWPEERRSEISVLAPLYSAFLMGQRKGSRFLYGDDIADEISTGKSLKAGRPKGGKTRGTPIRQLGKAMRATIESVEKTLPPGTKKPFHAIAAELGEESTA